MRQSGLTVVDVAARRPIKVGNAAALLPCTSNVFCVFPDKLGKMPIGLGHGGTAGLVC